MKTKILFLITAGLISFVNVNAQRVVALHSDTISIFQSSNPFVDAYNKAQDGDTIYLSGGSFAPPTLIDKRLLIIGAGYHPDTTLATFPTHIAANINYGPNASHLHIEGLRIQGNFVKNSSNAAEFIILKRVLVDGVLDFNSGNSTNTSKQITVSECIINSTSINYFTYVANSLFTNNIFRGNIHYSTSNNFLNNIFLYLGSSYMSYSNYNVFNNNIILNTSTTNWLISSIGNTFMNNIYVLASPGYGSSPIISGNYTGVAQEDIFVNQTGNNFSFEHDYNLQSPATYLGTDGTQVGIYGGYFPFKDKGVPSNPHISNKTISNTTDNDGNLHINISVHAQDE